MKHWARTTGARGVLGEPRGRILSQLCGQPQTAGELAERLGTSSSAVRVHLEALRDAGLVEYSIARRGVGKPTHVYSLTASAETLLSSAYVPALQALIDTLRHRNNERFTRTLREAGATLNERWTSVNGRATPHGVGAAVEMLEALGAPTTLDTRGSTHVLSNKCCPLAVITRDTPEACQLMEAVLNSASGLPVREQCTRGEHPRCSFVIQARPQPA
jgi:predicted ArsR family transcriptional regulator